MNQVKETLVEDGITYHSCGRDSYCEECAYFLDYYDKRTDVEPVWLSPSIICKRCGDGVVGEGWCRYFKAK